MEQALFLPDRDRFVPTDLTRGPWDPGAQHGGPPAALFGRLLDGSPEHQVARLSVEFLRPVPLRPLQAEVRTLRPGRNVQLVGASLFDQGTEVTRATALRIRRTDLVLPDPAPEQHDHPPLPEECPPAPPWTFRHEDQTAYHTDAVEIRAIGRWEPGRGSGAAWIRLAVPVVAGEETVPLSRASGAADFGNGLSPILHYRTHLYINPDLTVHLHRLPQGEWVALEARTWIEPHGVGLAESALYDEAGRIGRSLQSLLLDERSAD